MSGRRRIVQAGSALALFYLSSCATIHLDSARSPQSVASCIARGWEHCGASSVKVPVIEKDLDGGVFVGVPSLSFASLPSGAEHSTYPVWVEVTTAGAGSETEYRRAYQFAHACLDRVVRECQEPASDP